jgi:hypothetical protein
MIVLRGVASAVGTAILTSALALDQEGSGREGQPQVSHCKIEWVTDTAGSTVPLQAGRLSTPSMKIYALAPSVW